MRLLPEGNSEIKSGQILFNGMDIAKAHENKCKNSWERYSYDFPRSMTSLNPTMTIGKQISEPLIKHQKSVNMKHIKQHFVYFN